MGVRYSLFINLSNDLEGNVRVSFAMLMQEFVFAQVNLHSKHIGKSPEQIEEHIRRPKYFSPSEAVEYGIIDKV